MDDLEDKGTRRAREPDASRAATPREESLMSFVAPVVVGPLGAIFWIAVFTSIGPSMGRGFLAPSLLAAIPTLISLAAVCAYFPSKTAIAAFLAMGSHAIVCVFLSYRVAIGIDGTAAHNYRFFIPEMYAPIALMAIVAAVCAWLGIRVLNRS